MKDASVEREGCFVPSVEKSKYDKNNHSTSKTINPENMEDTGCVMRERIASKASDEFGDNVTVKEGLDEKDGRSVNSQNLPSELCKKGSSVEEEDSEGSLPRQGSMGFIVSGETVAGESEKSSPKQTGRDSHQNQENVEMDFAPVSFVLSNKSEGASISKQEHNVPKSEEVTEDEALTSVAMDNNSKILLMKDCEKEQPKLSLQETNHWEQGLDPSETSASHGAVSRNTEISVTVNDGHSIKQVPDMEQCQSASGMSSLTKVSEREVILTDGGKNPVKGVKDSIKNTSNVTVDSSCSTMNSADMNNACETLTVTTDKPADPGNCDSDTHLPSTSSVSGNTSRDPSLSSIEGSSVSSAAYIPSLSNLVQKSTFSTVVASSTVLSPEMEDLPSHPSTNNSTTPGSPSTLETGGPVSPLPPSPFHFFLPIPISPLPPSPVREVEPLSPLCSSPFDLEAPFLSESSSSSSSACQTETAQSLQEKSKSSISSSVKKIITHQNASVSRITKETKSSQPFKSGKKTIQSENTPRSFHAVAPPDAIAVKPQKNKNLEKTASTRNFQKTGYIKN
jgi:hypothetical protein